MMSLDIAVKGLFWYLEGIYEKIIHIRICN